MTNRTLTTFLIAIPIVIFCSCNSDKKEIYENVFLKKIEYQNPYHYSLEIKSDKEKHGWVYLVIDSLYWDNGKTIYTYGLALRSNSKGWHYVTNGPSFNEGGELPDEPYKKEVHTMTGKPLKYHKLISVDEIWNEK